MKTGVDIIHIPRISKMMENEAVLRKMLHSSEMKRMEAQHLAGRIALKEAFFKCFEIAPRWLDLEILEKGNGKPKLIIHSPLAQRIDKIDYSISHDGDYAMAQVVIVPKDIKH